jgi:hypothetical protein
MTYRSIVGGALVAMLALSAPLAHSADGSRLATQADLDGALTSALSREDAARTTITTLLQRPDVRSLAEGHGLDVRRAEAAVATLDGDELQRLSLLAADADHQLAGGDRVLHISLVAALLIVIIVILIAK